MPEEGGWGVGNRLEDIGMVGREGCEEKFGSGWVVSRLGDMGIVGEGVWDRENRFRGDTRLRLEESGKVGKEGGDGELKLGMGARVRLGDLGIVGKGEVWLGSARVRLGDLGITGKGEVRFGTGARVRLGDLGIVVKEGGDAEVRLSGDARSDGGRLLGDEILGKSE